MRVFTISINQCKLYPYMRALTISINAGPYYIPKPVQSISLLHAGPYYTPLSAGTEYLSVWMEARFVIFDSLCRQELSEGLILIRCSFQIQQITMFSVCLFCCLFLAHSTYGKLQSSCLLSRCTRVCQGCTFNKNCLKLTLLIT